MMRIFEDVRVRLALAMLGVSLLSVSASAEPVPVRFKEGLVHGFLVLRTTSGQHLADGDLVQTLKGDDVSARLTFRFADGSFHEETTLYSERGVFRVLRNRLVQKGPAFAHPSDVEIDATAGTVTVRRAENGAVRSETTRLEIPADLANGIPLVLLKNLPAALPTASWSFVAAAARPRIVKLEVEALGEEPFATGSSERKARHYRVHVRIGGVTGVLARALGKQPNDTHVWVLGGEAPAFVRSEGPLSADGPSWRIELTSPLWTKPGQAQ